MFFLYRTYIEISLLGSLLMSRLKLKCFKKIVIKVRWLKIDHKQPWKAQVIWNQFHGQNYLISTGFPNFEHTSSKNYPFFKCSSVLRETAVKRISFFLELFILYEVYKVETALKCIIPKTKMDSSFDNKLMLRKSILAIRATWALLFLCCLP